MKKIFALFVLCLLLNGCVDATLTPEPSPGEPTATTENPSPPDIHTPSASPAMPSVSPSPSVGSYVLNTDFVFDIELPQPINYAPEVTVFPLTSAWGKYTTGMDGSVTFVDEWLIPIDLPFKPIDYATVGGLGSNPLVAYALRLPADRSEFDGRNWVLMLADGTIPRGEDGKYVYMRDNTHNNVAFTVTDSAVVTYDSITGIYFDDEGYPAAEDYRYGLYDLEERRETLPREYEGLYENQEYFSANDAIVYACKDGQGFLLNSKGEVLHDFGDITRVYFDDTGYQWNTTYHIFTFSSERGKLIDGRFNGVYICEDALLAYSDSHYTVFDRAGQELFQTADWEEARVYAGISEPDYGYVEDEVYRHYTNDGPLYHEKDANIRVLLDDAGNALLRTEDRMQVVGDFVLRYELIDDMRNDPKTVYAFDGTVLLDNVYGWIDEVLAPGGGLFVYPDPETCVLLMPDGSTTPVSAAPAVEKVYWGG